MMLQAYWKPYACSSEGPGVGRAFVIWGVAHLTAVMYCGKTNILGAALPSLGSKGAWQTPHVGNLQGR